MWFIKKVIHFIYLLTQNHNKSCPMTRQKITDLFGPGLYTFYCMQFGNIIRFVSVVKKLFFNYFNI